MIPTTSDRRAVAPAGRRERDDARSLEGPVALHPVLESLFVELDRAGVLWCVLRGAEELARPEGDVDLLVRRAGLAAFRQVSADIGFVPLPAWGYGSHAFFLLYDEPADAWLKLDVVTELSFGRGYSLATGAEEACLQRRRGGPIPVLEDADAFWALLLHRLLDKGTVPHDVGVRLQALAVDAGGPLAVAVDRVCPPAWDAARVAAVARQGEWPVLVALAPLLAASWRRQRATEVWRRRVRSDVGRWQGRVMRPVLRRGLGAALLAPDGAGKSALASNLQESFPFPVRTIYMGLYQQPPAGLHAFPGPGLILRLLRQWMSWLDGKRHQYRGRLVLFDRYCYDARLPTSAGSRRSRFRRWLLGHSLPRPDLVVLLDAPGEVLYGRKGERSPALLEAERVAYRRLVAELPNASVVDATRSAEVVRRAVTSVIWRGYAQRWGTALTTKEEYEACGS